jgi:hypothetical protein
MQRPTCSGRPKVGKPRPDENAELRSAATSQIFVAADL